MKRTFPHVSRARSLLLTALAGSLTVAALAAPVDAASPKTTTTTATAVTGATALPTARLSRLVRAATAHRPASTARRAAAIVTGSMSITDPVGDPLPAVPSRFRADLQQVGITYGATSVRVSATLTTGTNPISDVNWRLGSTGLVWLLDTNRDGTADFGAVYLADVDGRLLGAVVSDISSQSPTPRCLASATWDGGHVYALAFPAACIGKPAAMDFGADMVYDTSQNTVANQPEDLAPDSGQPLAGSIAPSATPTPDAGALLVDGFGGLHFVGLGTHTHAPHILGGPYWNGSDVARGVATFPGGGHGYVLDGFGTLHPFSLSPNQNPLPPRDGPSWPNLDIARGVAVYPDGRAGVVLDGFGGLHAFSIGAHHATAAISGAPYWNGWDIARGVAVLPDGTGGFVLDGFGGLHFFSLGAHRSAPRIFGAPYWNGWAIARGVTLLPDGTGGYVVDAWGGLHFFSIGTPRTAPSVHGAPYWPGWQIARGVSVLQGVLPTS